jgi:sulfonate transport system ATP-binding protein
MRQRVALVASLITAPKLFLMDEPFAHLDALTRRKMWRMVAKLRRMNLLKTCLLVTHMVEEAVVLADRVVIMTNSTIQEVPIKLGWPRIDEDGVLVPSCSRHIDRVMRQVSEVNHAL